MRLMRARIAGYLDEADEEDELSIVISEVFYTRLHGRHSLDCFIGTWVSPPFPPPVVHRPASHFPFAVAVGLPVTIPIAAERLLAATKFASCSRTRLLSRFRLAVAARVAPARFFQTRSNFPAGRFVPRRFHRAGSGWRRTAGTNFSPRRMRRTRRRLRFSHHPSRLNTSPRTPRPRRPWTAWRSLDPLSRPPPLCLRFGFAR
mmetsp:Transcript_14876/g.49090  ORF Transcript_14876/g.49090 Transcript_14876/m.49090 type:complete len:203 (+) Transcript_14876:788-1396(+)